MQHWETAYGVVTALRRVLGGDEPDDVQQAAVTAIGRLASGSAAGLAAVAASSAVLPADDLTQLPGGSALETWAELYGRNGPRSLDLRAAFHTAAAAIVSIADVDGRRLPERVFHALAAAYHAHERRWPRFDVVHRREAGRAVAAPPYVMALLLDTGETARYAAYSCLQSLAQSVWGRALLVRGADGCVASEGGGGSA